MVKNNNYSSRYSGKNQSSRTKAKHTSSKATPARQVALEVLGVVRKEQCYLEEAWGKVNSLRSLPPAEKAFARLLATEVVARRGCLDELIDASLRNPEDLEPSVRDALRISFCEIFYLHKPAHVAVNEGVELVKGFARKASGLANYALHRAVEQKEDFCTDETDLASVALKEGFPFWMAERLNCEFGFQQTVSFMQQSNKPAPLFFVINEAKVSGPQTLKQLVERGLKIAPIAPREGLSANLPCFVFAERKAVADELVSRLLSSGGFVISDQAAQMVASLACPRIFPQHMLEIGAGRGTKSILLQNSALKRFGKQLPLETLDIDPGRTKERTKRLQQANITEVSSYCQSAENLQNLEPASYDSVFIDAPCSGVGTLRRHPDIRWRLTETDVSALGHLGLSMLQQAASLVKPNGVITYATCTVFSEENDQVIEAFLASEAGNGFMISESHFIDTLFNPPSREPLPDAHYVCVLKKQC